MRQSHHRSPQVWHALSRDHSFSWYPCVYPHIPACAFPAECDTDLATPGEMEDCIGLGITTASKQSAQDNYVTDITLVSKTDTTHCATEAQGLSVELMTSWAGP